MSDGCNCQKCVPTWVLLQKRCACPSLWSHESRLFARARTFEKLRIMHRRHTLPSEPAFYRKELHFFDDDLRFVRGLPFYAVDTLSWHVLVLVTTAVG